METVSIKLEKEFLKKIEAIMKQANYTTKTEFIREAIRKQMDDIERKQKANAAVEKYFGYYRKKNPTTSEEEHRVGEIAVRNLARRHGLKLD